MVDAKNNKNDPKNREITLLTMIMTKARKHPEEEKHERMAKVCIVDVWFKKNKGFQAQNYKKKSSPAPGKRGRTENICVSSAHKMKVTDKQLHNKTLQESRAVYKSVYKQKK